MKEMLFDEQTRIKLQGAVAAMVANFSRMEGAA